MTSSPTFDPPTFDDIAAAADRIAPALPPTPLLPAPDLSRRAGGQIHLKAENLQPTGAFKIRGATNFITRLVAQDPTVRARGVVAYSSGNHAQAVAYAARAARVPATIFMPADAPAIKRDNTLAYGAEIVAFDRYGDDRAALAHAHAATTGAAVVPPYDHPWTIAGQGTTGLEIAGQAEATLDAVLVTCGGGGLTAGIAIALAELSPRTAIYAVEPAGFDDTAQSLAAGRPVAIDPTAPSICDALLAPRPGELTFAINRRRLAGVLVVTDDQVRAAMAYGFATLKLVLEPGGAAALAALHAGIFDAHVKSVVAVLSGGNVDPGLFARIVAA